MNTLEKHLRQIQTFMKILNMNLRQIQILCNVVARAWFVRPAAGERESAALHLSAIQMCGENYDDIKCQYQPAQMSMSK